MRTLIALVALVAIPMIAVPASAVVDLSPEDEPVRYPDKVVRVNFSFSGTYDYALQLGGCNEVNLLLWDPATKCFAENLVVNCECAGFVSIYDPAVQGLRTEVHRNVASIQLQGFVGDYYFNDDKAKGYGYAVATSMQHHPEES